MSSPTTALNALAPGSPLAPGAPLALQPRGRLRPLLVGLGLLACACGPADPGAGGVAVAEVAEAAPVPVAEQTHSRATSGPSDERDAPTTAVPLPEPPPAAPDPLPSPTGPLALIVLSEHELLRSEARFVERVQSRLARGGVTLEPTDAAGRAAALQAWLSELDPQARARQPLHAALGNSRGLLVMRFGAPVGGRSAGVRGFGVLMSGPPRELLWAYDAALSDDALGGLAGLFPVEQP